MCRRRAVAGSAGGGLVLLFLDQFLLRQLADQGLGQGIADFHGHRHLVLAELVLQEALQLLEGEGRRIGAQLDERSEEHTSELQSLMRISYAVFCLKKKKQK